MLKSARIVLLAMICFCFAEPGMTQRKQPPTTDAVSAPIGLQIGEKAPEFAATDQFGREQSNETLRGAEGTVLLFFRSADWWPYCKAQLVQLQSAKRRFEQQGLKLAGISYDNTAILKHFSERKHVDFPLLSDPDSKIIRAYQVLNAEATGMQKGMARPGFFFIDPKGVIREKYFEVNYQNRFTPNNVMEKMFPELAEGVTAKVDAPHLGLVLAQSDEIAAPGSRLSLIAEISLPSDVHVYSPGVRGYKPLELDVNPIEDIELASQTFPQSKILFLKAINEKVPVFEGKFRVAQDVKINSSRQYSDPLPPEGKAISITGVLKYQACDKTTCYLPTSVPVKWQVQVLPLDRQRVPDAIQHK